VDGVSGIRYILMDVDNTLLDFDRCAESAMRRALDEAGLPWEARMFPVFTVRNNALWEQVEQGSITAETLYRIRWNLIFEELGIPADGQAFEGRFHAFLAESHETVPGAEALVRYLSGRYAVYVASNASYAQQARRLELAGLREYIRELFVSQRVGFSKPDPRFFAHCLTALNAAPEETVLIGDSLSADIRGGLDAGLHTCWYNPAGRVPDETCRPEWTVRKLEEIRRIL
jgi:2-haloacid dehalogenase